MKFAIIGTSSAAARHARAINHIRGSHVVAVCGSSKEHTDSFAKKYHITKSYTNVDRLYQNEKPDAVIIANIPSKHYSAIVKAAEYVKILIVEKPIVVTNKEVKLVKKLVKTKKCSISVVYQKRYSKTYRLLRNRVARNITNINYLNLSFSEYRRPPYFAGHRSWLKNWKSSGGGVLMQQGIHWINMLGSLFDYDFEIKSAKASFDNGLETEDSVAVSLLAKKHITCNLFFTRASTTHLTNLCVYGKGFTYEIEGSRFTKRIPRNTLPAINAILNRVLLKFILVTNFGLTEYRKFLTDVISKNTNKLTSVFLEDALKDILLINKIYE
jgi:predicted dehydrogenase